MIALDDAYDPKRTEENTRQLVEGDGVVAIFNFAGTSTTAGAALSREGLIQALEGLREIDLGGLVVRFSDKNHNGSTYVELTIVGSDRKIVR